ncbi:GntR family transcriptional regulator [Streptosporangium sp. NPDC051023]|uniref:GntR family transcriptional regulator n=1 Tax=Streptosporangium sp. NPDC051023 TaxID=3155410 RepID=UPI0034506C38
MTYNWIKEHIGGIPRDEGTFLTEGAIAEAAGTSRTPAREALLRLEAEGLLQIVPKKGAFVPPISDADMQAAMQARELVESWCIRQVSPASPELLAVLERLLDAQRQLLDDPGAFIDCDRAFHRTIVRHAGNPLLQEFYESLRDRQVRMGLRAVGASKDRAEMVIAEHGAIVDALRSGNPRNAADALTDHLSSTLRALGAVSSAVDLSESPWST